MIGIKAIKPFITGKKISVKNLPEAANLTSTELEYFNNCGVESIYDSGDCSSYDLAKGAAERLLQESGVAPEKIDAIIYIKSRVPDFLISSEATRLKYELNATKSLTFSITDLGCADISMALKLAKDILTANRKYQNILICYGNKQFSKSRFRYPVNILGDGGIAVLIGRTEENKIVDIQFASNGNYWDLFKIDYKNTTFDKYSEECSDLRKYGFELAIESRNRFEELNDNVIITNNLQKSDIKYYVLQNISSRAYDYYENAFFIKFSPVCKINLAEYGHLGSADIMLNYHIGVSSGLFEKGSYVLIMNNSPVAAWSSMLIQV
ncbi:MAG: 3-oxoacyl-[acyl-carrier-protein] synthase III C-terminal domain-containing protein [Chitinophagaceae bacterium]